MAMLMCDTPLVVHVGMYWVAMFICSLFRLDFNDAESLPVLSLHGSWSCSIVFHLVDCHQIKKLVLLLNIFCSFN